MSHAFKKIIICLSTLVGMSCQTPPALPLSVKPYQDPLLLLVWVGRGEAYVWKNNSWLRTEANDYDFIVQQRRYEKEWDSIKDLHRRHPQYDGKAGKRDTTMHFNLKYQSGTGGKLESKLQSNLGEGGGTADSEFRNARLEFAAKDMGYFSPFNSYRITQSYKYEEGVLIETVELFKKEGTQERPFAKIEEKAYLMAEKKYNRAPSVFKP